MPHRILVTDEVDPEGVAILEAEPSFEVVVLPTQSPAALLSIIGGFDAFVGRSATRIPAELLRQATRLSVIGRAGVGTDNIDIDAATALGIAIINAPAGNTIAVAELFFASVLGLLRDLPRAAQSMREGRWDRSLFMGRELKGHTLGIVGVGRIGGEVSQRALAFGMKVSGFDPYVTDERFAALRIRCAPTLAELLAETQLLTIHTPLNDETRGMIGRRELAALPPGAIVVNMARGGIVDEAALAAALESGRFFGAVLDVFSPEPLASDSPLRQIPNLLLTPHLGASTEEGQRNVAVDVCVAVRDALLSGELTGAVNVPGGAAASRDDASALTLSRHMATIARALLGDRGAPAVQRLAIRYGSDLAASAPRLLSAASAGVLDGVIDTDRVNLISARTLAEARGIELAASPALGLEHPRAIQVSLGASMQEIAVAGVAALDAPPRLTRIGGFHVDAVPRQALLIITNRDVPGVIGRVGTALGEAKVNIAEYHQARLVQGGEALAVVTVDGPIGAEVRRILLGIPDILSATVVHLRPD